MELLNLRFERLNSEPGVLHLDDGVECPKCLNRGFTYEIRNDELVIVYCECRIQREIKKELKNSGLEKKFQECKFDNFIIKNDFQKLMLEKVLKYFEEIMNGGNKWLMLSGQVGSGKTHLATALSEALIQQGYKFKYLLFSHEIPRLESRLKSGFIDTKVDAEIEFDKIKKVDVLFIDDFMKTNNLLYLFELIDYRYSNDLITIFTTEKLLDEMIKIDEALASRIYEKTTREYWIGIGKDIKRNYRVLEE